MAKPLTKEQQADRFLRRQRGEPVEPVKVTKDDVFLCICRNEAEITPYPAPISIAKIASKYGATQGNVRRCIQELKADGLVQKTHEGGADDEGRVWCIHGFGLTLKGAETETYQRCEREAIDEMARFLREGADNEAT